jgi:hypothetical protein
VRPRLAADTSWGILLLIFLASTPIPTVLAQSVDLFCRPGFVWREAVSKDFVCVRPKRRDQAKWDNRVAPNLWVRDGYLGRFTCKSGYVWREVTPQDKVCVIPKTRDQVIADNRLGYSRSNASLANRRSIPRPGGGVPAYIHDPSSDRWCSRLSPCLITMKAQFNDETMECSCVR